MFRTQPDPTADAGIDIGQRWCDYYTGRHFIVRRTYRDHPTNPSFQIEYESGGLNNVHLSWLEVYCGRAEKSA